MERLVLEQKERKSVQAWKSVTTIITPDNSLEFFVQINE